jgi:hypothetical protein
VAGREILVEGQAAPNARWGARVDDLKVGCANRNRIDADQDFCARWNRCRFVTGKKLIRVAQNPGFHPLRNWKFG